MKKYGFIIIITALLLWVSSCKDKDQATTQSVKVAFYNVENLFDTIDNPNTNDQEFLPGSELNWDTKKVQKKFENISKALISIDPQTPPSIIGLCEVENKQILSDFILHTDLNQFNYHFIHKESPDYRGIDVALLYKDGEYQPLENEWINVHFPFDPEYTTREILHSKGKLKNGEIIHLFVNHWTSRWGGQEVTEAKRIFIANLIKEKCDQIFAEDQMANIIIMGDLNDNPTDKSVKESLLAKSLNDQISNQVLYNLSLNIYENGEGTLFYKSWDLFDQMIVSGHLLKKDSKLRIADRTQHIFKEDWMLFTDQDGNKRPNRTASGSRYYGGFSDHLPIWLEIKLN